MHLIFITNPFKPKKGNQRSDLLLNSLDQVNALFGAKQFVFYRDFFFFVFINFFCTCFYFFFFLLKQ